MAIISDEGSAFVSHVIKEVAGVLDLTSKHATTKHARTVGLLERSHSSIKQTLKVETGERRSLWHIYVNIAVLNYNTSYYASIRCEPSRFFHGRIPYNVFKIGNSPTASFHSNFANGPRCLQKFHAGLHQILGFLRQKGQRFKAQRSTLRIYLEAESKSSRE